MAVSLNPLFCPCRSETSVNRFKSKALKPCLVNCSSKFVVSHVKWFSNFRSPYSSPSPSPVAAASDAVTLESFQSAAVFFEETFPMIRTDKVEGKIFVRLDQGKDLNDWELTVGCSLPGKWILHWGVSLVDDVGGEWDQPPRDMIPPGSVPIKDYAIETPMKTLASISQGDAFHEVRINIKPNDQISAINFVLKDEETGAWYQHKGRDFKVPLIGCLKEDANIIGPKRGFSLWPGALGQLSDMLLKSEATQYEGQGTRNQSRVPEQENRQLEGFYVELPVLKEVSVNNFMSVSVGKCYETAENILYLETDLPGDIVLHWGVCRDDARRWEVPPAPHPPETAVFKDRALRTKFQTSGNGRSSLLITLGEEFSGFLYVLKLNENTWLNSEGDDFYVPLSNSSGLPIENRVDQLEGMQREAKEDASEKASNSAYTDGIINEIRNLVTDIASERSQKTQSKEAQESILQEIERLAAEAYSIFRSSVSTFPEESIVDSEVAVDSEALTPPPNICSGTGTGYEILCQGFNWESHKSGKWYKELKEKAAELASLGFTVIWLPPPTESVSPEGYMPKDLYNLNSSTSVLDNLLTKCMALCLKFGCLSSSIVSQSQWWT